MATAANSKAARRLIAILPAVFFVQAALAQAPPHYEEKHEKGNTQVTFRADAVSGTGHGSDSVRILIHSKRTDVDCLGEPNQICARDGSGGKICTALCDPAANSCPWGSAASCRVWDPDVGVPTCGHRFGACSGDGKSCEPCVDEKDCPNGTCVEENFTGERYCIDLSVACKCPAGTAGVCGGGGCPPSPGRLAMTCYGGSEFDGTPYYGACVGADTDPSARASRSGCWRVQ